MSKAVRRLAPPPPPFSLPLPHTGLGRWQELGQGGGACWRFVAKVKWRPAANLHFMCQFLHFLSSYQREQNCSERGKGEECEARCVQVGSGITHSSWQPKPFLSFTRRPFAGRIMNMMGSLAASLGISAGQWGAILATKI